jgi:magnesium-transporting ATPase (P-type)
MVKIIANRSKWPGNPWVPRVTRSAAQVMITGDAAGTAISIGKAAMQANLRGETCVIYNIYIPIGSMVLAYMLTFMGYIDVIHVTIYIYSSTMDPI